MGRAEVAPLRLWVLGGRVAARAAKRNVNTVTTNVPGPQLPLYSLGRRMLEIFPFVPLAGQVRVGVAMFSYYGTVYFGITGDYDTCEDIGVLSDGIEAGMEDLLHLARAGHRHVHRAHERPPAAVPFGACEVYGLFRCNVIQPAPTRVQSLIHICR